MLKKKIFLWFLPVLSALILSFSLDSVKFGWLSLIGLVPFLFFLRHIQTKKEYFFGGWLFGILFFLLTLRWLLSTFSFNWIGVPASASVLPVVFFVWLLLSFSLGLPFGFFALLVFKFKTKNVSDLVIIPSLWVLAEYLKAWIFSFISWGPGASLGPYWTLGNLGYALSDTPFIFWSRLAGIYGVSFLIVFLNVFLFLSLKNKKIIILLPVVFLFLMFLPFFLFSFQTEKHSLKIAVLQTNSRFGFIKPESVIDLWKEFKKNKSNFIQPDIFVFPEGAQPPSFFESFFPDQNKPGLLVTGSKGKITYFNQKGELVDLQEKNFLVPSGEFLPIVVELFIRMKGEDDVIKSFIENRSLASGVSGNRPERPVSLGSTKVGSLLCSGVLSSSFYRSLVKDGAEILINSASLSIFNYHPSFLSQIKKMARYHAVANARPFVQAANAGPAFFISEKGEIIMETEVFGNRFLLADIFPGKTETVFSRFGDWPTLVALSFLLAVVFIRSRKCRSLGPKSQSRRCKNQDNLGRTSSRCNNKMPSTH